MSAKNWNLYYDKTKSILIKKYLADAVSLWIAIGLLWMSFLGIMGEHFAQFLVTDWPVVILFLVCLWLPSSGLVVKKNGYMAAAFTVAAMLIPVLYIVYNFKKIQEGILAILDVYLYYFNSYQGTNIHIPSGNPEYMPVAFTALVMLLWMGIWGIARLVKRPVILVLFPLTALLTEFLVGISPMGAGVFCLFLAGILLLVPKGTKLLRQGGIVAIAVLSLIIAGRLFDDEIDKLSAGKDIIFSWIEDFKAPTFAWKNFLQLDFITNNEQINNNEPQYTGEKILEIEADKLPSNSIYLRGFCGTDYVNGTWKWDKSAFSESCRDIGYSEQENAKIISGFPYAALAVSGQFDKIRMKIIYVNLTGNTAYVPYVFDDESFEKEYSYTGDYLIKKEIGEKEISFTSLSTGSRKDLSHYTYYASQAENSGIMQWYNPVAEEYARSSSSLECIKEAAGHVSSLVVYPSETDLWLSSEYIRYDAETLDAVLENIYRMRVAESVRVYLKNQMDYSLTLDNLPIGEDPVEYALTVGKEGYCMHYASAAALILKEIGIPARYVSGYIVRSSDFIWDESNATHRAEIEDYNSHAWVEIYLENIGWVPIEVTEGYDNSSDMLPTKRDPQETESETERETETQSETETDIETETQTETETESNSESQTQQETESEKESQSESMTETEDKKGTSDVEGFGKFPVGAIFKGILALVAAAAAVWMFVYGVKILLAHYEQVLVQEVNKNQTRRAVKRIHRRIHRLLYLRKPLAGKLTDAEYEHVLIEIFTKVSPEMWAFYMEIVKKMHYSHEEITHEEMLHCYRCYKSILPKFNISEKSGAKIE